jgi:predicted nucleotidyltransferase
MDRETLIEVLRTHEAELRRTGVQSLSLFGSAARGDAGPDCDVDIAVRQSENFAQGGFEYIGRMEDLRQRLRQLVGREVDIVEEPAERERLRRDLDEDRVLAF